MKGTLLIAIDLPEQPTEFGGARHLGLMKVIEQVYPETKARTSSRASWHTEAGPEATLQRARDLLEEYHSIPFIAGEHGMGPEERESWSGRVMRDLNEVLNVRPTCSECGAKRAQGGRCDCNEPIEPRSGAGDQDSPF